MLYLHFVGILTVVVLQITWISTQSNDEICTEELDRLADSVSNFTRCAVNEASPFRFCRFCYKQFDAVRVCKTSVYSNHYDCVKLLVESERYQIVKRVYDFANTLWEGSFCYNCFESDNKNEAQIGQPWVLKSDVVDFFDKQRIVDDCFKNYTMTDSHAITNITANITITNITDTHMVCSKCEEEYIALNDAYYDLTEDMGGYVKENILCADVVSAMNITRQLWSHQFNCVKHNTDTVSVVALTVLFCFFPIIFYSAARLHGGYKEKRRSELHIPQINYNSAE
ncbi:osteopetrosis-associated transmembrane protein 1 [Exaiptasia diaphana]|uniref:Osteopetrosis-associated transmembrane protein 1 n=1 Tax=Exaiptasia diaphana TaxID=2652724 RepID=A0A913XVP6_EXADI|nr:osteopetrosis-associated transmembrane protein 1 [Exaiptasia diaphana]KXJ24333.1 Osteopetrosis-associated transmembrane protein 1 [Exaiptasia diaphana]